MRQSHDHLIFKMGIPIQWSLYKATTRFCGLSRQVVFHNKENKHDFYRYCARWITKSMCKTSPVSLYRFHCTWKDSLYIERRLHSYWPAIFTCYPRGLLYWHAWGSLMICKSPPFSVCDIVHIFSTGCKFSHRDDISVLLRYIYSAVNDCVPVLCDQSVYTMYCYSSLFCPLYIKYALMGSR